MLIFLAVLAAGISLFLLWLSARQRKKAGLPIGRVIYSDTGGWGKVEKPFYDGTLGLTGKPDYVIQQGELTIPVEVKSSFSPTTPHESHIYQLAAYLVLITRQTGKRPPFGVLHYRNRTFAIDFTEELENNLVDLITSIRRQERLGEAARSHEDAGRCARCGYRSICHQKI